MYPHYSFQHSILFIDDLKKSENLVRHGLLSYPAQFEFCRSDYDHALSKLSEVKPDLLVVSLEFQAGSILDFAQKVRKEWAHLPSIFMTEPHLIDIQNSVLKLGAFDVVDRPVEEPTDLIHRMERAVSVTRKYRGRKDGFIELHNQSRDQGVLVAEILDKKTG